MKYYRIIDIKQGSSYESAIIWNDFNEAFYYLSSEWDRLTDHDKKLRDAFFLGEYKSYEDAENNVNYDIAYKIK